MSHRYHHRPDRPSRPHRPGLRPSLFRPSWPRLLRAVPVLRRARAVLDRLVDPHGRALARQLWAIRQLRARRLVGSAGMTTAEYAVGTLAACAFAAVLIAVVRAPEVRSALSSVITAALHIAS